MAVKASAEITVRDETDVLSLVPWYALTQSATAPTKPSTTQTSAAVPSPWTTAEPSFDPAGGTRYLYTCIQTRWKDGTCTWDNNVQLSSAYEQAKQAWNKANAAQSAASSMSEMVGTLEAPYTEVEWVESNGKQFVYLDWKPKIATWGFEADFIIYNAFNTTQAAWDASANKNNAGAFFGVRNTYHVNDCAIMSYGTNGELVIGGASVATSATFKKDKTRQSVKLRGTTLTHSNGTTTTVTRSSETSGKPYGNMTVFAFHDGLRRSGSGSVSYPGTVRIYSLKFYDSNTLECDLVGAIRKSDGITGLYDKVAGKFYPAPGMTYGTELGDLGDVETVSGYLAKNSVQAIVDNHAGIRMLRASVPELSKLEDGQQIRLTYMYAISASVQTTELAGWDDTSNNSNVYLKLTLSDDSETEWIPCYYNGATRLTTHYYAGQPLLLTYRENVFVGASATGAGYTVMRGFFCDPNYNTDDPYTRYSDTVIAGLNGVKRYSLNMKDANGNWTSIMNQDNNVAATGKTAYTGGLMLGNVLYHNSGSNIDAGGNTGQMKESHGGIDLRYDVNGVTKAAATTELQLRKPVYLVGSVHDDGLFYLNTTKWWTQTPNVEGAVYVYLGTAYSSYYAIFLSVNNPTYIYTGGELVDYEKWLADEAAKVAGNYIVSTASNDVWIHTEGHGPDADGNATSDTYGWRIGSVFELVRAGLSYLKMWVDNSVAKVRVGLESAGHSVFSPEGMEVFTDADTSVASFGAEGYRVGDESALHQVGDGTSLSFRNGSETVAYVSTDKFYSVNSEVEDAFYIGDYSIRNASDGKLVIGLRR